MPIWRNEEGTEEILIGSVEELYNEIEKSIEAGFQNENPFKGFEIGNMSDANYDLIDLHKNIVDKIILVSASGKPMKRESDLIDVWFDSGSMPYAQWHYPFECPPQPSQRKGEKQPIENSSQSDILVKTPKYQTARNSSYHYLKQLKEKNKNNPTPAEKALWSSLKGKKLENFKFRRQHVIDEFIADFICLDKKLIVEVDGGYHLKPEIIEADNLRTQILEEDLGYKVIRFTNDEVLGNTNAVLEQILTVLNSRTIEEVLPFGKDLGWACADFIAEGVDQTRGWFYTLHAISTLVFDRVAYKNVVSNGLVLDKNGQKMSKRLGNAADPFQTLSEYGPDATRWYMISNANPWDNLKFDLEGIAEVRRKFFGTLYNTYSFFALYANIDGFTYAEPEIPINKRPEIDRWILSELNTLIKTVDNAYADYEPTKATRAISDFVQENLSNWYVRLCRRRFWKPAQQNVENSEQKLDKTAAYQTLYTCLVTISKLAAPIAPFFMDKLYRDLTQTSQSEKYDSVHLSQFPESVENFVDKSLERRMQQAQTISSLVLSLRKREMIKVRQPLQKIMIPVLDAAQRADIEAVSDLIKAEVNVKEIVLLDDDSSILIKRVKPNFKALGPRFGKDMGLIAKEIQALTAAQINELDKTGKLSIEVSGNSVLLALEDVEISSQDIEGWLVANANGMTVALDILISPTLKQEGIARELVNRIQNIRKDSGFEVTDKITVQLQKNEVLENAVSNNMEYIKSETQTNHLFFDDTISNGLVIEFDDIQTKILISK